MNSEGEEYLIGELAADEAARRRAGEEIRRSNLRPFRPGQSGNPSGRRRGALYVQEWINIFLAVHDDGTPKFTREDIESVAVDPKSAPAAIIGANRVLLAMESGAKYAVDRWGKAHYVGMDSGPGIAFEQIMDYLDGKPTQRMQVTHDQDRTPDEIERELCAKLKATPGLWGMLVERFGLSQASIPPMADADGHIKNSA